MIVSQFTTVTFEKWRLILSHKGEHGSFNDIIWYIQTLNSNLKWKFPNKLTMYLKIRWRFYSEID